MIIQYRFEFGQTVYLKTDDDQKPRIVVEILAAAGGYVQYRLAQGAGSSWHQAVEISSEKNMLAKFNADQKEDK